MLEVTKTDLVRLETIMKMVRRGKYELEGEEVLAFAQAYAWGTVTIDRIKADLEAPAAPPAPAVVEAPAKVRGRKSS